MREYLYNIKMAVKRHGFIKSLSFILTLTSLHLKRFFINGSSPKKERIHGSVIWFFDYAGLTGLYEEVFIQRQYFFEVKNKKPIILDCGSNIGMSVLYFKKIYPDAIITAFEPDPLTFELLKKTIEANCFEGVTAVNKAVAGKKGSAEFYSDTNRPGNLHMSLIKRRVENGSAYKVEKDRLSSYIKTKVDFLKMDVEGAEAEVIVELDKTKSLEKINLMAMEIHHNICGEKDLLHTITGVLVKNNMKYNISSQHTMPFKAAQFQDILLYAEHEKI
jgi:FkbM family methyltransferase